MPRLLMIVVGFILIGWCSVAIAGAPTNEEFKAPEKTPESVLKRPAVTWNYYDFGSSVYDTNNNWCPVFYPNGIGYLPSPGMGQDGGELYDIEGSNFAMDDNYLYVTVTASFDTAIWCAPYNHFVHEGDLFFGFNGSKYDYVVNVRSQELYQVGSWNYIPPGFVGGYGNDPVIKSQIGPFTIATGAYLGAIDYVSTFYLGLETNPFIGNGDTYIKEYRISKSLLATLVDFASVTSITFHATMECGNDLLEKTIILGSPAPVFQIVPTPDTADIFYIKQADIDGDNYADVIYTGNTSDSLYIAYGKADGTLETPRNYLKVTKAALAVDFVNGDSLLDIVAHTTSKVYVLLNLGSRSFTVDSQEVSLSSWGSDYERSTVFPSVATGYFNDDTHLDIVASENEILYGDGTGDFPTSTTLSSPFDAVDVGDFDRDGSDDIVVTAGDSAFIYLNDGDGNMTRSAVLCIGYLAHDFTSVVSGMDLNADGKTDFVTVTGNTTGTNDTSIVTIALGDGNGGVARSDTLRIVGTTLNLVVVDIDKDHDLDISLVNATTRSLVVTLNGGTGDFALPASIPLGSYWDPLYALINADLDRNGAPDFVIGGQAGNPILLAINQIADDPILPDEMVTTGYNHVTLQVENPLGLVISRPLRTIAGSAYWRMDADGNNVLDESAYDYNLQYGEYRVVITPRTNLPDGPLFSVGIRIDGTVQNTVFQQYSVPAAGDSIVFYYQVEPVSSIYPANGKPTANPQPTFRWSGLVGKARAADSYEFQLDRYYDFRSPIFSMTGLTSPQYHIPHSLGGDSVFYWRIRPVTGGIPGDYSRTFAANLLDFLCGDANGDGTVDISDVVFMITYIFSGGSAPEPLEAGDCNCDGTVDISDAVCMIAYIFSGGPAPCAGC